MTPFFLMAAPSTGRHARAVYGTTSWAKRFPLAEWHSQFGPRLETIVCPRFPGHQRGGRRLGPLRVVVKKSEVGDFVWTWHGECLLADRVVQAFQSEHLTGFDTAPASVYVPRADFEATLGEEVEYSELLVTGKGGAADPATGIRRVYECPACGLVSYSSYKKGLLVDLHNWDGSDFFTLEGYEGLCIVTERVLHLIARERFLNCMLTRAEDEHWPEGVVTPEQVYGPKGSDDRSP